MGILGNMAKNTAREYGELLCKGVAGLGLLAFSQITYTAIEGARKVEKKAINIANDEISGRAKERRRKEKEQKEREERSRRTTEIYEDMKRRQKESMERGGR